MTALVGYAAAACLSIGGYFYLRKQNKMRKYQKYLLLAAVTGALCLLTGWMDYRGAFSREEILSLDRNPVGQGARAMQLQLEAGELFKEYPYAVTVEEQKLTATEAEELFTQAKAELEQVILGENKSPDEISHNLKVPSSLIGGAVEASVTFEPYELISPEGVISWDNFTEDSALVKATAHLSCQEREAVHEFYLRLAPPPLTGQEALLKEIGRKLSTENQSCGEDTLTLPKAAGGTALTWHMPKQETHLKMLVLGALCMVVLYISEREKQERKRKAWDSQLLLDYPDIVSQLSLLTGAGMTVPAAWEKLALEYRDQRQQGRMYLRPGYEEMLKTWHEMQSGQGELRAYDNFGQRCGKPQYRKFSSLLIQNLRKGTRGMQQLLDAEAEEAFEQRKARARQLGEEAGTKLLLPMGLMLLLVFAVLLVPAMLSMGV